MKIPNIQTYSDGRMPVKELYNSFLKLENRGWTLDKVGMSKGIWNNKEVSLPIIGLRTPQKGKAIYILSGVHGEEPAGPNALAQSIDLIAKLGEKTPIVLLPLCNPMGYLRNWRYLNMSKWIKGIEGSSVGDSEHYLIDINGLKKSRLEKPSSIEAKALTDYLLKSFKKYQPLMSVDLHEDDLIPEGYIYSQGKMSYDDLVAKKAVQILIKNGVSLKTDGLTRFDEKILNGVVGAEKDGSIDEFISSEEIIKNGKIVKKNYAKTSLVIETPAKAMKLDDRIKAQKAIISNLENFVKMM